MNSNHASTEWLDVARWIATIAVIAIHVVAPYIYQYGQISLIHWSVYNVIDSITRFAVPFFVMLSGALLLNRDMPLIDFLKKRFLRILIPFLFWSLIYITYHFLKADNNDNYLSFFLTSIKEGASYHLWYIYMIIGLYLSIPVLNKFIMNSEVKLILFFLLLWFLGLTITFFNINLNKDFSFTVFSGYIGYLILGYFIAHHAPKINASIILIVFALSVLFTCFATLNQPFVNGVFNGKYYQYLSINVVLASASLFMLIKNKLNGNMIFIDKIKYCNQFGFGVYLIHVLVLDALQLIHINGSFINPVIGTFITIGSCYLISLSLIALISRIRFISSLVN